MPLPPLHTTALAWLHFKKRTTIDLAALTLATNVPDLEPFFIILARLPESHGLFHSYLGALLFSPPLALIVWLLEHRARRLMRFGYRFLRLKQPSPYSFAAILLTCLVGWLSHVFFDMWTHETFRYVLFPNVGDNPFWFDYPIVQIVEASVLVLSAYSVLLWVRQVETRS